MLQMRQCLLGYWIQLNRTASAQQIAPHRYKFPVEADPLASCTSLPSQAVAIPEEQQKR